MPVEGILHGGTGQRRKREREKASGGCALAEFEHGWLIRFNQSWVAHSDRIIGMRHSAWNSPAAPSSRQASGSSSSFPSATQSHSPWNPLPTAPHTHDHAGNSAHSHSGPDRVQSVLDRVLAQLDGFEVSRRSPPFRLEPSVPTVRATRARRSTLGRFDRTQQPRSHSSGSPESATEAIAILGDELALEIDNLSDPSPSTPLERQRAWMDRQSKMVSTRGDNLEQPDPSQLDRTDPMNVCCHVAEG